jgi:hypothetical protein
VVGSAEPPAAGWVACCLSGKKRDVVVEKERTYLFCAENGAQERERYSFRFLSLSGVRTRPGRRGGLVPRIYRMHSTGTPRRVTVGGGGGYPLYVSSDVLAGAREAQAWIAAIQKTVAAASQAAADHEAASMLAPEPELAPYELGAEESFAAEASYTAAAPYGGGWGAPTDDGGHELPDGWTVAVSRSTGQQYYYNESTQESSYEWPVTARPAQQQAPASPAAGGWGAEAPATAAHAHGGSGGGGEGHFEQFMRYDRDGDGFLSRTELRTCAYFGLLGGSFLAAEPVDTRDVKLVLIGGPCPRCVWRQGVCRHLAR